MDAKGWNIANSLLGVPKMCGHLLGLGALHDNFTSNTEIPVKPCSPESATIHLYIHLLAAEFISGLVAWGKLDDW